MKIFKTLLLCCLLPAVLLAANNSTTKYWISFTDKGPDSVNEQLAKANGLVTPRSLERRAKVFSSDKLVDYTDLPVYSGYVRQIREAGFEPVHYSRWLNAISVRATGDDLSAITELPFVSSVQPVLTGTRTPVNTDQEVLNKTNKDSLTFDLNYGYSKGQLSQINLIKAHEAGYFGQNVLIAILDSGFKLEHHAFEQTRVLDTWDFINDDPVVDNEVDNNDVYNQYYHGTQVLSELGGYAPGELIGAAVDAEYLLAKTESIPLESIVEEDNWVAAAEWADSLGADIISTSVGYTDWYTPESLDGLTAPITRAVDLAVEKGIVVVTSAGNEGDKAWFYISVPADAFNVISVGAVDLSGNIQAFSSRGPTADGRIKPEVVALGAGVYTVEPATEGYLYSTGTSFACPLVAGAAALILTAHPELTPLQVREALINTADRADDPNNEYGYGLVNTVKAINYWGEKIAQPISPLRVSTYPNPFYPAKTGLVHIVFHLDRDSRVKISIYNILGQKVAEPMNGTRPQGVNQEVLWNGRGNSGNRLPSGIYFCRVQTDYYDATHKLILLQ